MKDSLYVAGGYGQACSERLCLKSKKWFRCQHSLPYPLVFASVVVSDDEKFAVITGGIRFEEFFGTQQTSNGIIIFTEEDGFQSLKTAQLQVSRHRHLSLKIPS